MGKKILPRSLGSFGNQENRQINRSVLHQNCYVHSCQCSRSHEGRTQVHSVKQKLDGGSLYLVPARARWLGKSLASRPARRSGARKLRSFDTEMSAKRAYRMLATRRDGSPSQGPWAPVARRSRSFSGRATLTSCYRRSRTPFRRSTPSGVRGMQRSGGKPHRWSSCWGRARQGRCAVRTVCR